MRSSSSSIRGMTSVAWSALKGRGCWTRRRGRDERAHMPGLARADGARPGPPVQALHGRRGAAPRGVSLTHLARIARRGRDLLRSGAPRLQPRPHRSRRGRGAPRDALVRRPRMGDLRPRSQRGQRKRRLTTLRRVPAIVIPYRGDAKRRLPSSLRAAAAVAMLGDVVEAAAQVGRVLVVTDDASVVHADLPAATPAALRRLAEAGLALVEAPDGTTNALSLPDPGMYAALYGPGS